MSILAGFGCPDKVWGVFSPMVRKGICEAGRGEVSFDRTDLTFEQKWLYMALVMLIESIPSKEYQTYARTIEEIERDTHHQGPIDPLSLFDLADKGLIRLTETGDEYAIAIAKR